MSESVKMPALGESVTEGTVTRWLKEVGESVEVDEPLLEVSTDKVDTEIPSPVAGVLEKILVEEDETVEVGTELAVIGDSSGGAPGAARGDASAQEEPSEAAAEQDEAEDTVTPDARPATEAEPTEAPSTEQEEPTRAPSSSDSAGEGQTVKMPALGESVTEGTVTRWLKEVGESVEVDEPLVEISTDKVDTEMPSPYAGKLVKILVEEDETVEVGTPLAQIGGGDGAASPEPAAAPAEESAAEPAVEAEPSTPAAHAAPAAPARARDGGGSYVTPIVRKLAREKSVNLGSLAGTGVGGRIRKEDVIAAAEKAEQERAAAEKAAAEKAAAEKAAAEKAATEKGAAAAGAAAPSAPAARAPAAEPSALRGRTEKMSRLRKVIAKRMVESLDVSAQLTTVIEVDVTKIAALRAKAKGPFEAREGVKLTFLPFFVKAAIEALKVHPTVNATIDGENVIYHDVEHIGIAVDTPRGLLVPVIKDAGDLNIAGIAKRIADLAARTRDNKVLPDELSGSTFTVTNTGSAGALFDTPIINQPEVAILGVGLIVKRPAVVKDGDGNESIGIRSMIYLAITYDHRLVDGADAGRFLQTVKKRLEEGEFETELGL
ncbi:MAG TPA: 2-oxoglutarate dehydrogenase, E2 component, dihydrolipoamide succinyltransferase [Actinomycetaceae bacterium]|nr:2-oxoglutarate dehydrogenase, E2 component, dihydrolipoamide succinyltransferase [Actinomycetaceae bacterium]